MNPTPDAAPADTPGNHGLVVEEGYRANAEVMPCVVPSAWDLRCSGG